MSYYTEHGHALSRISPSGYEMSDFNDRNYNDVFDAYIADNFWGLDPEEAAALNDYTRTHQLKVPYISGADQEYEKLASESADRLLELHRYYELDDVYLAVMGLVSNLSSDTSRDLRRRALLTLEALDIPPAMKRV